MKLKITTAEALILWRLLNEGGSSVHTAAVRDDINGALMDTLWDRLDNKLVARGIRRSPYPLAG